MRDQRVRSSLKICQETRDSAPVGPRGGPGESHPCQAGSTTEGRVPSPHEPVLQQKVDKVGSQGGSPLGECCPAVSGGGRCGRRAGQSDLRGRPRSREHKLSEREADVQLNMGTICLRGNASWS